MREELEIAAPGAWERRGPLTDDWLELLALLWRNDGEIAYTGRAYRSRAVRFEPKPRTRPRIEVGGNSRRALRRAARFGDAWHAIQLDPEAIRQSARILRSFEREVGREHSVAITLRCTLDASRDLPPDAPPWRLGGSGDRFADAIGRYVDAGVETFVFDLQPEGDEAGHRSLLADLPALVRSPAT